MAMRRRGKRSRGSPKRELVVASLEPMEVGHPANRLVPEEILDAVRRGRNAETVRSNLKGIEAFGKWMGVPTFPELCTSFLLGGRALEERQGTANRLTSKYRAHLFEKGYAPSTVKRRLDAVKMMVRIARTFGMVPFELEVEPVPVQPYRDTQGPGTELFLQVIEELENRHDAVSRRDSAILTLCYENGLRRNEVASLVWPDDIDLKKRVIWITAKKKLQKVADGIPPNVVDRMNRWLEIRGNDEGPLFHRLPIKRAKRRRLDGSSVWRIVRKYGLGRTHGLRHLSITDKAREAKGDIIATMKHARHKDPKTTMAYIDNLNRLEARDKSLIQEARNRLKGDNEKK